jgi:multicomponent Na+:H+ antiporter subunit C
MEVFIAVLIGWLATCATLLLLSRSLFRIIIGLALLGQVANVLVFSAAGLGDGGHPIIESDATALAEVQPDPLAQALVLTAIVIGFGVLAFCLVLFKRMNSRFENSDVEALAQTEQ